MDRIPWPYQGFSEWPSGMRGAFCITWDVDDETPVYSRPASPSRESSEIEQRRYGMRRAMPLIVNMLQETGLPAAFYIPAYMARQWPSVVRGLSSMGYEIGGHGYLHEPISGIDRHTEATIVAESLKVLRDLCEAPVIGYRTPSWQFNAWTPTLLAEAGLLYDSSLMGDIAPYGIEVNETHRLIEIPIHWYWDDVEFWGHTQTTRDHTIVAPSHVLELWKAELQGVVEAQGSFVLTLHPHVSGHPGLLAAVRQLIAYAQTIDGLWITTPGKIAEHVRTVGGAPVVCLAPTAPASQYLW